MTWLILVIASAVFNSLSRILQKVLLREKDSEPFAFAFIFQLFLAFLFFLYAYLTKTLVIPDLSGLTFNLIIMAVLYSLGNIFIFYAFKTAEASEASIIFASSTLWTVVSAIFFLNEKLTVGNIVGILLIVIGLVVVNYSKSKWKLNKGHLFAILAAACFGIAFTNDAFIINRFTSVSSYMMICFILTSITILLFRPKLVKGVRYFMKGKVLVNLLICAVFYSAMLFSIFEAYKRGGQASIISPISQSSLILTVVASYFLLKEKNRLLNKIIGVFFTFVGVLFLV